jgi:hypothetical protein
MTYEQIIKAIRKINPTAQFSISGNDIDSIVWENGQTPIAKSDIEAQLSSAEFDIAIEKLRAARDKLIAETDYLALSDQTLSDDMRTYRQSLRDITNGLTTVEQVNSVTWPTKP